MFLLSRLKLLNTTFESYDGLKSSFCTNPDIVGEKHAKSGRVGGYCSV